MTFRKIALVGVFIVFAASAVFSTEAFAQQYSGTVFGRRAQRGYFDNHLDGTFGQTTATHGNVLPDYPGYGDAIPSFINTVPELYNFLRSNYNNNSNVRKTGASFIVNTMLGRNGNQARRTVSAADWAEVLRRMNARQAAGKIDWDGNTSGWINSYKQGRYNDDAFFRSYRNRPGIVFRDDSNRIIYRLVRGCANPLGDSDDGLPAANQWSVEDDSYIQKLNAQGQATGNLGNTVTNAKPGERYQFHHRIFNQGPDATDRGVVTWRSYEYPSGSNNSVNRATTGAGVARNGTIRLHTGQTGVIPTTAGGQQWCSRAYADPRAYNNAATFTGEMLCVRVPFDYNLLPNVSVGGGGGTNVEEGSTGTTVDFGVNNEGPTQSRGTRWQLIRFEVAPNGPAASANNKSPNNNNDGCTTHRARAAVTGCNVVRSGTGRVFNVGNTAMGRYIHDTGDVPIGTRICFALSISTPTEAAQPSWGHSQPACVMVVKKPKIQILGGDLWVGRQFVSDTSARQPADIATGTSSVGGRTYGSWSEYGIFATGSVNGMASGAALANGAPTNQAVAAQINKLTFANTPTYGNYTTNPGRIPDYIATYAHPGSGLGADLLLNNANGNYKSNNNVTLRTNADIPKGRSIIIHANNITINNDIKYADNYGSLEEIPRVVIIADGNISINPNVERIDAWIIAKETLYTCNQRAELTINVCNKQLAMNGPVAVKELSLRRTHGSDSAQGRDNPAEKFNLRPDAILKSYETAVDRGRAQTVYQVELPPRY